MFDLETEGLTGYALREWRTRKAFHIDDVIGKSGYYFPISDRIRLFDWAALLPVDEEALKESMRAFARWYRENER